MKEDADFITAEKRSKRGTFKVAPGLYELGFDVRVERLLEFIYLLNLKFI